MITNLFDLARAVNVPLGSLNALARACAADPANYAADDDGPARYAEDRICCKAGVLTLAFALRKLGCNDHMRRFFSC